MHSDIDKSWCCSVFTSNFSSSSLFCFTPMIKGHVLNILLKNFQTLLDFFLGATLIGFGWKNPKHKKSQTLFNLKFAHLNISFNFLYFSCRWVWYLSRRTVMPSWRLQFVLLTHIIRRKMKSFLGMFFMRTPDVSAQGTLVPQLSKFSICSIWEARWNTPSTPTLADKAILIS